MSKAAPIRITPAIVRAHFILRGDTYVAWGRRQGFDKSMLCRVISGRYRGVRPVTRKIKAALENELRRAC